MSNILDGKRIRILKRSCAGTIAQGAKGKWGFGFDPVFIPQNTKKTFAQMSLSQKNKISHRGKALQAARVFMKSFFV